MQTQQRVNWARVKEARRRLQAIVRNSRKLGLKSRDLAALQSANILCPPTRDWSYWLLLILVIGSAALGLLYSISSLFPLQSDCFNGTTPEPPVPSSPNMPAEPSEYEKLYQEVRLIRERSDVLKRLNEKLIARKEAPIKALKDDRISTVRESHRRRRDEESDSWVGPRIRLPKDR